MSTKKNVTINESGPTIIEADGKVVKPERKRTESGGSGSGRRRRRGYQTQTSYTSECSIYSETSRKIYCTQSEPRSHRKIKHLLDR